MTALGTFILIASTKPFATSCHRFRELGLSVLGGDSILPDLHRNPGILVALEEGS